MDDHSPYFPDQESRAKSHTNYHRIQELIQADIIEGRLEENVRLKVVELAERYGVSPIPIREALQRLEGEGLVVISSNRGARVRVLDEHFLRNIIEIIQLLEPYLIRGFVQVVRDEDIVELEAIQKRIEAAANAGNFESFHQENGRFHACIYGRHFNDEALRILYQHRALRRTLTRKYPVNGARMRQSCQEHRKILEAILVGDAEVAAQAMAQHVERSNAYLLALLRSDRSALALKKRELR
jgi:DNA-binding GntR family transcriptional regulator